MPYAIFVDPSFARVGLTEAEAKEEGYNVTVNTAAVAKTVRSGVINDDRGLYKAVIDNDTKEILGVTLFGDQGHELVNTVKLAMDHHLPYTALRDQMMTHPVMSEIFIHFLICKNRFYINQKTHAGSMTGRAFFGLLFDSHFDDDFSIVFFRSIGIVV